MLRELVLALGIPVALLLLAVLVLQRGGERLPGWLQEWSRRPSVVWNVGVGLILALSLLRWLLRG